MRVFTNLLSLIVAIGVIWFSIVNRHHVTVTLDPFPLSFTAPLYLPVLLAALLGLIAGGIVSWRQSGGRRARLRQTERERDALQRSLDQAERKNETVGEKPAEPPRREVAEL